MCCAAFVAKYVLFIANLVFSLAGIAIMGLGIAVLVQLRDILEILPVNFIPISLIVIGCVVFVIAFCACCGAIKESRCMLIMYAVCMSILVALMIYLSVVIFTFMDDIEATVNGWITSAFNNNDLRQVYHTMESLFRCCGTVGPSSYDGVLAQLPPSCCASPVNNTCAAAGAFAGCTAQLSDYFETFGGAIGGVLVVVVIIQGVAIIFASFLSHTIANKAKNVV